MTFREERQLNEKITELQRTIQFLCNTMANAIDDIDKNPVMVKMILKDAVNDSRYEFR